MNIEKIIIIDSNFSCLKKLEKQVKLFVNIENTFSFSTTCKINHSDNRNNTLLLWSFKELNHIFVNDINVLRNNYQNLKIILFSNIESEYHLCKIIDVGIDGFILKDEPKNIFENMLRALNYGVLPFSNEVVKSLAKYSLHTSHFKQNPKLTRREKDVYSCLIKGLSNKVIARNLGLSAYTVADYNKSIYHKYNVKSRVELVSLELKIGHL